MYADGGGLYLQVSPTRTKSWIFRFVLGGCERAMGLGPLPDVSLAEAREKAAYCRKLKRDGTDPIEARKADRSRAQLRAAKAVTFKDAAEAYVDTHKAGWRNEKHIAQWSSTLNRYVYPVFGSLPVQDVDVGLVMRAIEPIWTTKAETARRIRGRIEAILNWATARGYRQGDNPARWRGHLENLLLNQSKTRDVSHYAALPYSDTKEFIPGLRQKAGVAARALEFLIFTAARTGEVIGARWNEINLREKTWMIPAERMKGRRAHRVPLSSPVPSEN